MQPAYAPARVRAQGACVHAHLLLCHFKGDSLFWAMQGWRNSYPLGPAVSVRDRLERPCEIQLSLSSPLHTSPSPARLGRTGRSSPVSPALPLQCKLRQFHFCLLYSARSKVKFVPAFSEWPVRLCSPSTSPHSQGKSHNRVRPLVPPARHCCTHLRMYSKMFCTP